MSTLREPSLGPIVGHTTDRASRIWIRGAEVGDEDANLSEDTRTIGVLAVAAKDFKPIPVDSRPAFYFRLHREYDRTGTFVLGEQHSFKASRAPSDARARKYPLEPGRAYTVQVGSLTIDDSRDNDEIVESNDLSRLLPRPHVWCPELDALDPRRSTAIVRTGRDPAKTAGALTFLLGSCRYPGLAWKRKHADRIFGPMAREIDGTAGNPPASFSLMVGDQIYADMFHRLIPIGLADTAEEFQERYLTAFGSRNMSRLLRTSPTYMILDDHEIEDNWTQDRIHGRAKRQLFNVAIGAYCSYQWSHGPRNSRRRARAR